MDPLLAARRLPTLSDRAVRDAFVAALLSRRRPALASLVEEALLRFERAVQLQAGDGVRPALLFAQRDRIVRTMRVLCSSEITARLFSLHRRDVIATGSGARPFDVIVRASDGGLHAVLVRRLPPDGRRLERLRAARMCAKRPHRCGPLAGVVVVDLQTGTARAMTITAARTKRAA